MSLIAAIGAGSIAHGVWGNQSIAFGVTLIAFVVVAMTLAKSGGK